MAQIEEIINILNSFAPLNSQEIWDNSGWQVRLNKNNIKKCMLCITVTDDIVKQAVEKGCDLIISHHPLIFNNKFNDEKLIKNLIRKHLPVFSIHTPFDKATEGTTDSLIKTCGFEIFEELNEYIKIANCDITMKQLIQKIKTSLNLKYIRVSNYQEKKNIKKIAFCAGSGAGFWEEVQNVGCDCFITSDLKYHTALDSDICIIDVGHLESEKPSLQTIKSILKNIECEIAQENSPILIV